VKPPHLDREPAIDRLLRRSMGTGTALEATDRCLDAESLAAWVDGALPADAAAAAEAHASSCGRCQAMLATLVRTAPPPASPESWWRRRWFIAGLVPLTAGATAIAIWVATPGESTRTAPASAPVDVQLPAAAPSQPPAPAASSAQSKPGEEAPAVVDRFRKSSEREQRAQAAPRPGRDETAATPRERQERSADARRRDDQPTARLSVPVPPVAPPAAPLSEAKATFRVDSGVRGFASPDASVRWRIGAAGMIQRSADGGATWTILVSGATEDLTAAAAPSATVCWIVGRAGTVLLSTDGVRWQRVGFPERVDLTAIQATDSRDATVTTVDGRRFRTADGGRTWTPLQEF
jgi:Photosynthesis system II assembly factor YCF48/Putative zinc-finger